MTKKSKINVQGTRYNVQFAICLTAMFLLTSFMQVLPFGKDLGWASCSAQNIGINATGAVPNSKAMLDIDAATMSPKAGLLIPRMSTTERNAIAPGASENSLLIFNTTTECFEAWYDSSSTWVAFGCIGCTPTPSNAGPDQNLPYGNTTTTLAANTPTVGTGAWSVVSGTATITTTPTSPTSGVTGLAVPSTATLRWTISNAPCTPSTDDVIITTTSCCPSGSQVFAAANINVGTRINGAPAGQNMTAPGGDQKYCYNDIEANCTTYGGLYEWGEAMNYAASINCDPCGGSGVQGICPAGYHIPTDLEWSRYEYCIEYNIASSGSTSLSDFQTLTGWRGTNSTAGPGAKMKVTSSNTPAWNGTNTSGFSALPAGYRNNGDGSFFSLGSLAYFWSATEVSDTSTLLRFLDAGHSQSDRHYNDKTHGFSVRCVQN